MEEERRQEVETKRKVGREEEGDWRQKEEQAWEVGERKQDRRIEGWREGGERLKKEKGKKI